jgi:hypothetical protein
MIIKPAKGVGMWLEISENGLFLWGEKGVATCLLQQDPILLHLTRIVPKVFGIVELKGVYEDATDHLAANPFGPMDKV